MPAAKGSSSKKKMLAVLEILKKYSDENNPINSLDIISRLEKEYGIIAERKSVYSDIAALKECGVDIERVNIKREGYYFASRRFEPPEIRLLTDAVLSARFITLKKTRELIQKLSEELSVNQAKCIEKQVYYDKRVKFDNEQIYYVVDTINSAIEQGKKISFIYHHKKISYNKVVNDEGKLFVFSPYALFWEREKYYVAGNYGKYDSVSNYRLDKMERVEICEEPIRPFSEVSKYRNYFDTADYVNKSFMMYYGEEDMLELICDNKLLEIMVDRFGESVRYTNYGEGRFRIRARAYISEGLEDWIIPYCDRCYIKSPDSLREKVIEKAMAAAAFLNDSNNGKKI